MNTPLISIIMPAYNSSRFIEDSIRSVLSQTYTNFELIVVDDHSTDNTKEIIEKFKNQDNRVFGIFLETNNGGPAQPRNIGLKNAEGNYIAFLDSDDIWETEKLSREYQFLVKNNADIVCTSAILIDESNNIIGNSTQDNLRGILSTLKIPLKKSILYSNFVNINTVLMRKCENTFFNSDKNIVAIEDWLYWIELLNKNKKIVLLNENLIRYRVRGDSISVRGSIKSYLKIFYMYKILYRTKYINILEYLILSFLNTLKIIRRKVS